MTDGRQARRERGRAAVIDTAFELVSGGELPTVERVAAVSGVSVATIFRYFDGVADLQYQAFERFQERFAHLFEIPDAGAGTRDERVRRFVATRVGYYSETGALLALGRARALDHPPMAQAVRRARELRVAQVLGHFAPELANVTPARRSDLVSTLDTLTSPEAWDVLLDTHARTPRQVRRAWVRNVDAAIDAWEDGR